MQWLKVLPVVMVGLGTIGLPMVSQARVIDEIGSGRPIFKNAATIVPANAQGACVGDVVKYETRYNNRALKGTLWIKRSDGVGCNTESGDKRITGYFEERGANGQWCSGTMDLVLKAVPLGGGRFDSRGSLIKWSQVKAVPGFACDGAGRTTELTLRYIPLFSR